MTTKKTMNNATINATGYESISNALAIYGANLDECNVDFVKNSDANLGAFLYIRTESKLANLNKQISQKTQARDNEETTEAEKQALQERIDELEAEKAIFEPLHEALKSDGFGENIDRKIAIYAYGPDKATTLHLDNLDELKSYATRIRNMGKNHYVHIKSLADTKKAKTPTTYKELKQAMQGMLNAMLPDSNLHINGDCVFAMCNILVNLNCGTDKNLGIKSGMKYAKVESVIRQMCKLASILMAKREDSLKVKEVKEQVKKATKIEQDNENSEPVQDTEKQDNAEQEQTESMDIEVKLF